MADFEQQPFGDAEFLDNPQARCPCILLLDVSASMSGAPIEQLNEGLRLLQEEIQSDSLAAKRVELAIVTFGPVNTEMDFTGAANFFPPHLSTQGNTPMRVHRDQGRELWTAFRMWEAVYWRPIEINREFARHFGSPNWLQRLYRGSMLMLRRALRYRKARPSFVATSPDNPFGSGQSPLRISNNLDRASFPFLSGTALVRARARLRREAHSVGASNSRK